MLAFLSRVGRRPLARSIVILAAVAALGACADETTAPEPRVPDRASLAGGPGYTTSVTLGVVADVAIDNVNGATVQIPVKCSSPEAFDLFVDVEQEQRIDGTKVRIEGTTSRYDVQCDETTRTYTVTLRPYFGDFQPGRAIVDVRVGNQQPWVEPETISRRVRLFLDLL